MSRMRLVALISTDTECEGMISAVLWVPDTLDIAAEKVKWRSWYVNEYCPSLFRKGDPGIDYDDFSQWLVNAGARELTDKEIERVQDDA
jgi:hypothetical protein